MKCSKCDTVLDENTWPASLAKRGIHWCRACWNAYFKARYHKQHPNKDIKPALLESIPVSQEQLAWATGLWEAKGSILIDKGGLLTIRVVNQDILLLTRFRMVVGCGKIRQLKGGSFAYSANGLQADRVVRLLFSFVVTKQGTKQIQALTSLQQPMQMMPDSVELAWVAGVFDGVGSMGSYMVKNRKTPVIVVKMCNTQKDMLERVKAVIGMGGSIYESRHARRAGHKPIFYYSLGYAKATEFLKLILHHSRCAEKVSQIEAILGTEFSRGVTP